MKAKKKLHTFIDLFCGIGGFRLALEEIGLKCVWSNDNDKHCAVTYKENFGEKPDTRDIKKVLTEDIPSHDVLCAGFPCQAFSISGKQKGFEDTRGTLFFDIARIAKYHQPKILFLENVRNFEKHDNGRTIKTVNKTLDEIGYDVFYKVLDANHYGVPQSRKRIYIVGFRKDLKIKDFEFPKIISKIVRLKDVLLSNKETKKCIIRRKDIKLIENPPKLKKDIFGNYPLCLIRVGTIGNGGQGERIYSEHGHAIALTAYGGGIASKTGAYLVKRTVRKLSPYECSQIMGFPKDFKIPANNGQAYKQFGNSVVVPVLECIFKEVLNRKI